ncbi:unnamed protein product [Durusdinium trenchii]|uniref:Solute carrier family 40 protein n=1 Tax=Durusdinium trenchii TaxID=1381693 RepID=A0ABP0S286_9DINO
MIAEVLNKVSEAQEAYDIIEKNKDNVEILESLHSRPSIDPCKRKLLTAQKPMEVTDEIDRLANRLALSESEGREMVAAVMSELQAAEADADESLEESKALEKLRKEQMEHVLHQKKTLDWIEGGAGMSNVVNSGEISEEQFQAMSEEEQNKAWQNERSNKIEKRFTVTLRAATELHKSFPSVHEHIRQKEECVEQLKEKASEAMEARVAVFQHVERVEKHLDEETRKSIRCEEERGKSTDQLQVAMDNLQETRKAFLNALIAAVDARIESDADYQHEKRMEPLLFDPLRDYSDDLVYRKLLLSHGITRLATQAWFFIAPLVLLRFTPGRLEGPAVWGLATMLGSALLTPPLGAWADRMDRCWVVTLGVSAQALAVLGSTWVLALDAVQSGSGAALPALGAFTCFSVLEELASSLSDVVVKRDWAPRLFEGERLRRANSMMSQIDLWSKALGPFLAGLLMTLLGDAFGFVAVGLLNVLSFPPQLLLLRSIYTERVSQLQPLPKEVHEAKPLTAKSAAWRAWLDHPSGIQFLGISYSLLYLTVLSPAGPFLTAHLAQWQVSSLQLSLFRGAGALVGVAGVMVYPFAQDLLGPQLADAVFALWLATWILLALDTFHQAVSAGGASPALLIFMCAVCLARPGLYGFELGLLNTQQDLSDARHRSAIGAVDSALVSLATLAMYGSGLVLSRPEQFVVLVDMSTLFVSLGVGTYLMWMLLYHSHKHRLGESMSATRSELQKAVEARDLVLYRCDQVEKQVAEQTEAVRQKIEEKQKDLLSHTVPSVKEHMLNLALSNELLNRVREEKKEELEVLHKERDVAIAKVNALSTKQRGNKSKLDLSRKKEEVSKYIKLIESRQQVLEALETELHRASEQYEFCRSLGVHHSELDHEDAMRLAKAEADRCLGSFEFWKEDEAEAITEEADPNCTTLQLISAKKDLEDQMTQAFKRELDQVHADNRLEHQRKDEQLEDMRAQMEQQQEVTARMQDMMVQMQEMLRKSGVALPQEMPRADSEGYHMVPDNASAETTSDDASN